MLGLVLFVSVATKRIHGLQTSSEKCCVSRTSTHQVPHGKATLRDVLPTGSGYDVRAVHVGVQESVLLSVEKRSLILAGGLVLASLLVLSLGLVVSVCRRRCSSYMPVNKRDMYLMRETLRDDADPLMDVRVEEAGGRWRSPIGMKRKETHDLP